MRDQAEFRPFKGAPGRSRGEIFASNTKHALVTNATATSASHPPRAISRPSGLLVAIGLAPGHSVAPAPQPPLSVVSSSSRDSTRTESSTLGGTRRSPSQLVLWKRGALEHQRSGASKQSGQRAGWNLQAERKRPAGAKWQHHPQAQTHRAGQSLLHALPCRGPVLVSPVTAEAAGEGAVARADAGTARHYASSVRALHRRLLRSQLGGKARVALRSEELHQLHRPPPRQPCARGRPALAPASSVAHLSSLSATQRKIGTCT